MNNKDLNNEEYNTMIFLEYIKLYGFKPENYNKILELVQGVQTSMSLYLKKYNQFLLSEKVNNNELSKYGIIGSYGYLNSNNIYIPEYLINKKENTPSINDFDVIIARDISSSLVNLHTFNQDKYIGTCIDIRSKKYKTTLEFYKMLLNAVNSASRDEYKMLHDSISSQNKELYLIKKCK